MNRVKTNIIITLLIGTTIGCSNQNSEKTVGEINNPDQPPITIAAKEGMKDLIKGADIYAAYCAQCHGANLEGGQYSGFMDGMWNYGSGPGYHQKNIKFGIIGTQMPAWKDILSDAQIEAVVDYILEKEKEIGVKPPPPKEHSDTEHYTLKVEVLAQDLKHPWGIEFLDERTALFSEGAGQLRLMVDGKVIPTPITGTPSPASPPWKGFMDIALHPRYTENGWIYLSYIHQGKVKDSMSTRIVRGQIRNHEWVDEQVVYEPKPEDYIVGGHFGSRMVFDDSGYLYFTIGDRFQKLAAQNLSRPEGKFHRVHDDGRPVEDNPYNSLERYGALPTVFAYGSRNAQGIAIHPETREIWSSEHGPMGGDELNLLQAGANYGWPLVTKGVDRDGTILTPYKSLPGMVEPIRVWTPSPGICGIEFVDSPLFPAWKNNLLVAALKNQHIYRLVLDGDKVVKEEIILRESGRIRDIKTAPDGSIYVLTDFRGMILRLTPERSE